MSRSEPSVSREERVRGVPAESGRVKSSTSTPTCRFRTSFKRILQTNRPEGSAGFLDWTSNLRHRMLLLPSTQRIRCRAGPSNVTAELAHEAIRPSGPSGVGLVDIPMDICPRRFSSRVKTKSSTRFRVNPHPLGPASCPTSLTCPLGQPKINAKCRIPRLPSA
jgi:hypothetical protein